MTSTPDQEVRATIGVMVVDDDPFMLSLLKRMLELQGFRRIVVCPGAGLAFAHLSESAEPIDLLLCDLNMPDIDGLEFVRGLVARHFSGSLILVSGAAERVLQAAEKLIRAHSLSLLGCLTKPVSNEGLRTLLRDWPRSQAKAQYPRSARDPGQVSGAISKGELVNYYQPKVEVASGNLIGVETLVRWNHPEDGLLYPDQFIGVAEENGLIDDLTRVVTTSALRQARNWLNMGLLLHVAINVSMDNLTSLSFPDFMAREVARFGVAPEAVLIEVTESRLMRDLRAPLEVLTRLRLKGFRLSIDDFGTGHSSFAQLRDLPFDELKVDRGFVHHAWANKTTHAIYGASLSLAKQLDLDIVGEGVEDRADWDFLRQTGCDYAQGYFVGRPMPAAELPRWIASWQGRREVEFAVTGDAKA